MRDLFIYIDPGFLDHIGHYRSFAENIRSEVDGRRVEIWHLVNTFVSGEAARQYDLERVFDYKAILTEGGWSGERFIKVFFRAAVDRASVLTGFIKSRSSGARSLSSLRRDMFTDYDTRALRSFALVVEQAMDRALGEGREKVTLYMYTSHPQYFLVLGRVLNMEKYSGMEVAAWPGLFYLNAAFCAGKGAPEYAAMLRECSEGLERADPRGAVRLCADSDRIIDMYAPYFRRPIELFPIPLLKGAAVADAGEGRESGRSGKVVLGFFGYAHRKQGYHLMHGLYREMIKDAAFAHVRFMVRHNFINNAQERAYREFSKERLRITHMVGDMRKEDYDARMSECDVVLIPHCASDYRCRTSGSFVEALARRKAVIVPEDTWMADRVRECGSGEVFRSDDLPSFVAAVKRVCADIGSYRAGGARLGRFVEFHAARTLLDKMGVGAAPGVRA